MSNYALYIKERLNKDIIEDEFGYAVFSISEKTCYIEDIFVRKEARRQGLAFKYIDKVVNIAKEMGCTRLLGSVVPDVIGATGSMKMQLSYGFELYSSDLNMIYLTKEI